MKTYTFVVLCVSALVAPLTLADTTQPKAHAKVSSFAPQAPSASHEYGAPVDRPILSHHSHAPSHASSHRVTAAPRDTHTRALAKSKKTKSRPRTRGFERDPQDG